MSKKKSAETAENQHPNKIGIKDASGYAIGDAGNLFNLTYISSYLKLFMTDVLKISPARTGMMFIITRLWDCINDPIWGAMVAKRAPGKDGKFRPYLKWVSIPLGLATILCFLPYNNFTQNQTLLLAICYVTYIFYGMMYTGMNIPFGSLASVITDDPKGRTLLSTFRSIGSGVGGGVVSLIAPLVIYSATGVVDPVTGKDIKAADGSKMFIFGLLMGIFSIIFYLWSFRTTKERVPSEAEPKVDFKKTYVGLLKSRPFVTVALAGVLISGQLQFNSFNNYLYKNYFTNTNLGILGTICNYLPTVVLIFFMPKLVAKFGKKELCGNVSIISAIGAVFLAVVCNNQSIIDKITGTPGGIFPWPIFMIILLVIGFGYTFISLTCWAVVMDVIDYQEYTTGIRNESAVYAVYTFARKLGQTIADASGLFLLQWAKYDSETAGNGFITENDTSKKIMLICTVIPAVVYTCVWLLMKFGYPLTKEKLVPIYDFVREKREAAANEALTSNTSEAPELA
ncbi:MAG: glycoside-pentoside-hexuronide (GPH):cation symporter [Faecalibacterium sp.]|nr:glycoside-pentoside-hexuronide (GPH):cation symporter [Ruminococcus sp.]MCM1391205.1 glycoside-pentoside-hexuronide (GPH):cation symporter [Ruminococcus sp.]MCM1485667.1 glycoside-pentoside-hexuronide (GPH):cation symporter [Faecalibacterium sp.]